MVGRDGFGEASQLLKTLGHPIRLKIVCGLLGEPSNLSRIAKSLGVPISTLAQHLAVLRSNGILEEQRQGVEVIFHVADERVPAILHALCSSDGSHAHLPRWDWKRLNRSTQMMRSR